MKQNTIVILSIVVIMMLMPAMWMTSCKKSNNSKPDSAVFLFHLHTQIVDSTIGGNVDGYDSNATPGSHYPWYFDSLGRHIELIMPQFFISNIMLVNQNGNMLSLKNVVILKGLDSEDYYLCKVPIGTYVSAMFTVGIANGDSIVDPATDFIVNGQDTYPIESTMWTGTDYYGMFITGEYDTSAAGIAGGIPVNPVHFKFAIPNGLTIQHQVSLPIRTAPAGQTYGIYVATAGSTNYIHILCDYGKLLTAVNLLTSNNTSTNPLIADSLANKLTDMFRYEQ
jgi:hypothetical protein